MPWCPFCHRKYLPEYSVCPKCDIKLIEQKPVRGFSTLVNEIRNIKPDLASLISIALIGFIVHIFIYLSPYSGNTTKELAVNMLLISLYGLFMGLVVPSITTSRAFIGSLLGGIPGSLIILPAMGTEWSGDVAFATYIIVVSATLTAVSVSAHRLRKNHNLRHTAETVLLIAILTCAPYILEQISDMLTRLGGV